MRNLKRVLSLALALVMMLGMMIIGASAASAKDFPDAAEIDYTEAVDVVSGLGVMTGDDKGNFNPTDILTREQAAKIMAYIMLGEKNADKLGNNTQIFADVAAGRWSAGYIAYCTNVGILAGYGNGNFGPEDKLTGVAFAKMLLTAAGYDAEVEGYSNNPDWATNIAVDAIEAGIDIKGVVLANELTREQAAQMVLQALEMDTVEYVKGNVIGLIGPYAVEGDNSVKYDGENDHVQQFCEKYFPTLKLTNGGHAGNWNRPVDHTWTYGKKNDVIARVMLEPEVTYTEAVTECDIAEDLGLRKDTKVDALTINGVNATADADEYFNGDDKINTLATKKTVGEQGRLTEIYDVDGKYEVVMIDTFLAKVTDVTEVEYDRNGHISEKATLTLDVYVQDGSGKTEVELKSDKDYSYDKGDMLLIYAETEDHDSVDVTTIDGDQYVEILGIADTMVGAQTAYTNKNDTHIVEDKEYSDAYQFNLDEAVNKTSDYTWYFDSYGNLIGATEIAAQTNYGVISSIYWRDSRDGENGYAWANITYMDGTSENVKVWKIAGAELEGVEGKGADYTNGYVSSTKQYNAAEFVNVALYKITEGKKGLVLTETTKLGTGASVETGVPNIDTNANATKSTLFLVWNGKDYETYTGIKNVPSYKTGAYWAANIGGKDITAEYVFIKADAVDAERQVTFYAHSDDKLTIKSHLKSGIEYYSITGGYVNGEEAAIQVKANSTDNKYTDNNAVMEILDNQGNLLVLDLKNDFVDAITVVTDDAMYLAKDKVYAVYAGAAADASLSSDGSVLYAADNSYYVDEANTLSFDGRGLKKNIKDGDGYLYVVYTQSKSAKTAQYVIVTDVENLLNAQENAIDALVEYINNAVLALDPTKEGAAEDDTTDISAIWGAGYETMAQIVDTWSGELMDKDTVDEVWAHLDALENVFDDANAAFVYVAEAIGGEVVSSDADLTAAIAAGGDVVLAPGTYTLPAGQTVANDLTIIGTGDAKIVGPDAAAFTMSSAADLTIKNVTIEIADGKYGVSANNTSTGEIVLENVTFVGGRIGVILDATNGGSIKDCTFDGTTAKAISLGNSLGGGVTIEGNAYDVADGAVAIEYKASVRSMILGGDIDNLDASMLKEI